MKKLTWLAVIVLVFIASAEPVLAQGWPLPANQPNVSVPCQGVACPPGTSGRPTQPWSDPIVGFTGRFLDSSVTRDFTHPLRTARAIGFRVVPERNRIYIQIGHALASYRMDTFFNRLAARESLRGSAGGRLGEPEVWLNWDSYFYSEDRDAGWLIATADGQDRLFDWDFDDRGMCYLAYSLYGWGIVEDTGSGLMPSRFQDPSAGPAEIFPFKSGSSYYVLVGGLATPMDVWNVTNPTAPIRERTLARDVVQAARAGDHSAIVSADGSLAIYRNDQLALAGSPLSVFPALSVAPPRGFRGVASDGTNFYAASFDTNVKLSVSVLTPNASRTSYSQVTYPTGSTFDPGAVTYAGGYLGIAGRSLGWDGRVFKINSGVPTEIPLNDYILRYYGVPNPGHLVPGYIIMTSVAVVPHNAKLYMAVSAYGLGDVYELKDVNSLSASYEGRASTANPNAPPRANVKDFFYGDRASFLAAGGNSAQQNVNWNFGNTEAGGENIRPGLTGSAITHQFAGLAPGTVPTTRTVTATNPSNNTAASASVLINLPKARFALTGAATKYLFAQPDASSAAPIVVGDTFQDASDGDMEGHYARWDIDGSVLQTVPFSSNPAAYLVPVGACSGLQHTLNFEAHYGPHSGFVTTGPDFPTRLPGSPSSFVYLVRPFAAAIDAPLSNGQNVTFTSLSRATADTSVLSAAQVNALSFKWDLVGAQDNVLLSGPSSAAQWVVSKSQLPAGDFRARLTITSPTPVGGSCAGLGMETSAAHTSVLKLPDPVISGGCTLAGGPPCNFSVSSQSGISPVADGWTFQWIATGTGAVNAAVSNASTYSPTFTAVGPHTVSVVVNNAIGQQIASTPVQVSVAGTTCPTMSATNVFVNYAQAASSCTYLPGSAPCAAGQPINFSISTFNYDSSCGSHTYQWNIGGATYTGQSVTHTFSSNGNFTASCVVSNGGQQFTATAQVVVGGFVTPPTPPPTPPTTPPTSPPPTGPGTCPLMTNSNLFINFSGGGGCSYLPGSPPCPTGQPITFNASSFNYDDSCRPHTYSWVIPGGGGFGKQATHTFNLPGSYSVTLNVNNGQQVFTPSVTVNVGGTATPPTPTPPVTPPTVPSGPCGAMVATGSTTNVFITFDSAGCTAAGGNCGTNNVVNFSVQNFTGYDFACANHTFTWSIGGQQKTGRNVTHTFATPDDYPVSVSVFNGTQTVTPTATVKVRGGGNPNPVTPTVTTDFAFEPMPGTPTLIRFTPSISPATGNGVTQFRWSFGDGGEAISSTATQQVHLFEQGGRTYTVTLRVLNASGGDVAPQKTKEILVGAKPPAKRRGARH